jgi:hypothetical protein
MERIFGWNWRLRRVSRQNNVHCWNADRIHDCRIALAAAARMVMRWLARMRKEETRIVFR